jgi:hypothetical protein
MQKIADFSGSFAEMVVLMKRESEYISGAARRLKAIEQYLAEAVRQHRNPTAPGSESPDPQTIPPSIDNGSWAST